MSAEREKLLKLVGSIKAVQAAAKKTAEELRLEREKLATGQKG